MQKLFSPLSSPIITQAFVLFISFASLAFAYGAEFFYNVQPCPLCLYERYIYVFLFLASLSYLHLRSKEQLHTYLELLVLGGGLALTFYHLGVENHWWQPSAACKGGTGLPTPQTLEELKAQMAAASPPKCTQHNWDIFSVSAVLWSLFLLIGTTFILSTRLCILRKKR